MKIISRDLYFRARKRHKALHACFYAFILAQMSCGWLYTEGNSDVRVWLLRFEAEVALTLQDFIPAIGNVVRDYYADGHGSRAHLGRYVAAMGWMFALIGFPVFAPLFAADAKFLKRMRKFILYVRRGRSGNLRTSGKYLAISLMALFFTVLGVILAFNGAIYNFEITNRSGPYAWMGSFISLREYNLAVGIMTAAPFVLTICAFTTLIHAFYANRLDNLVNSQYSRRQRQKNK